MNHQLSEIHDATRQKSIFKSMEVQLACELPGIILSGDLPSVLRALKESVPNCRFLSKPVDTKALLEVIDELSTQPIQTLPLR